MGNEYTASEMALLEKMEFNLSDFALFLSVMKNKEAYENTLSIIMDDPDLKLKEVKQSEEWEAVKMSILSVGLQRGEEIGREIGQEIGKQLGKVEAKQEDIISLLEDIEPVSTEIREKILKQKDLSVLRIWLKKASRAESVEAFAQQMEDC